MHPVLLKLGPFSLYSYGAMIALGFLAASWLAVRRARSIGLDPARIQSVALAALFFGILGGRAAYIALNWPVYRGDWLEMIRLDHGGLVFYGGFAAGLAAAVWMIRRKGLPFWPTVDLLVPLLVLAHAFGRIGCFLNGCCYGKPASVPWAVVFPQEGIPRHPTQLYEAAFLFLLFLVLSKIALSTRGKQSRFKPRSLLWVYGLAYGLWRFFVEFLREDNPVVWAGLTVFQLASIPLILVSGTFLMRRIKRSG